MKEKLIRGIIYLRTSPSGKVYVGQTCNEEKRQRDWKLISSPYTSKNSKIDNARKKYGPENFTYEILFETKSADLGLTKKVLADIETYYINYYNSTNIENGYNTSPGGVSYFGENNEDKIIKIPIIQLTIYGKYVKRWESANEAAKEIAGSCTYSGGLLSVCRGEQKTAQGFIWMFEKDYNNRKDELGNIIPSLDKIYYGIVQLDLEGNYIKTWESTEELKNEFKTFSHILSCCKGKRRKSSGFRWVYKIDYDNGNIEKINFNKNNNSRKIVQLSLSGDFIKEWDSVKDAVISLKLKDRGGDGIRASCNNDAKSSYGYIWIWKSDYNTDTLKLRVDSINNKLKVKKNSIIQLSLSGDFIKEWSNLTEIQKVLKIDRHLISKACRNKTYIHSNYIWVYKEEYSTLDVSKIAPRKNRSKKKVIQLSLDRKFIKEWDSIIEVDNTFKNHPDNNRPLKNILTRKSEGLFVGYIWIREEDYIKNNQSPDM